MHHYGTDELVWNGLALHLGTKRGRKLATVQPDAEWLGMWRVRMADGHLSDMTNLSRAKDAATLLALGALTHKRAA
jgi:hypothetical protein